MDGLATKVVAKTARRQFFPRIEIGLLREDPSGAEHEVIVEVEYSFAGAEPDVGIMSGYVEVQAVYLQNEDGSDGPMLHWSQTDEDDFQQGPACDLLEDSADDGPDPDSEWDSRCDR